MEVRMFLKVLGARNIILTFIYRRFDLHIKQTGTLVSNLNVSNLYVKLHISETQALNSNIWMPSSADVGLLRGPRIWSQQTGIRIAW